MAGDPKFCMVNVLRGRDRNADGAGVLADEILACLARAGYVIVHPDDVPERDDIDSAPIHFRGVEVNAWLSGWNACRAHLFGGDR